MKIRNKIREIKKERQFNYFRLALFSFIFFLFSININAQDSIPEKEDLTEETELKFQEYFFKSLSEKAIGNYQKAIENLENCNQIFTNDVAVFFELSKNYFLLDNSLLAKEYVEIALKKEPNNFWMLKHLVEVYQKDKNYKEAIKVQQKIIQQNPKEREFLVRLYLYNRQVKEAYALMDVLEKENTLPSSLKRLRENINNRVQLKIKEKRLTGITNLINQFKVNKSYKTLEQILKIYENKPIELLKYSEEGIALFPAQPYVYLVKARALNYQKKYKNALTTLQNGIDFVIEDEMEVDFYNEIAKAYRGLGDTKQENNYIQKAKKLKSQ